MLDTLSIAHAEVDDSHRTADTWISTIALLKPQHHTLTYSAEDNALRAHAPIVSVIERPSATMAVVSWRDATHCRYGEQVWAAGVAREDGVCALTGRPIARSDAVFRPQRAKPPALNAEAMILASAMEGTCAINAPVTDDGPPPIRYRSNAR